MEFSDFVESQKCYLKSNENLDVKICGKDIRQVLPMYKTLLFVDNCLW